MVSKNGGHNLSEEDGHEERLEQLEKGEPVASVDATQDKSKITMSTALEMCFCAGGLMLFFLAYGVIQERIMTQPYGDEGAMFKYSAWLVFSNRIVAIIASVVILIWQGKPLAPEAPISKCFAISFSNTTATYFQYEALKYVTFPTQTLGKCGKTIPVLILGSLIGGKKYELKNYVVCIFITLGCTIFSLTGDISAKSSPQEDSFFGLILMGGYLFFDGFTSVFQEILFHGYKMSTYNQMLYVNLCSGILTLSALVMTDQLVPSIMFSIQYPALFFNSFLLSLAAMLGQVVIYHSIRTFGALFFATVMTTRQLVSIMLSCLLYFHPLTMGQWLGASVTFAAIYYEGVSKKSRSKH